MILDGFGSVYTIETIVPRRVEIFHVKAGFSNRYLHSVLWSGKDGSTHAELHRWRAIYFLYITQL